MSNDSEKKDCRITSNEGYGIGDEDKITIEHLPNCNYGFHCIECGSHQLSWLEWVNEKGEVTGEGPDPSEAHCDGCGAHGRIASDAL